MPCKTKTTIPLDAMRDLLDRWTRSDAMTPLSPHRLHILVTLYGTPGGMQQEALAQALGITQSALSRSLSALSGESRGMPLIASEIDRANKRFRIIQLTQDGVKALQELGIELQHEHEKI